MAFTGKTALSAAHIHYSLIKLVLCLLLLLLEKHFALLGGGRPDPGRLRTCGMLVVPG